MKFAEFIEKAQDEGILVARVSSGRSFCGEPAEFKGITPSGNVKLETESGKRIRVKDVYGKAVACGKAKDFMLMDISCMGDDNFFKNTL